MTVTTTCDEALCQNRACDNMLSGGLGEAGSLFGSYSWMTNKETGECVNREKTAELRGEGEVEKYEECAFFGAKKIRRR